MKTLDYVNQVMEFLGENLPGTIGSSMFWGEEEVPESVRKQLEDSEEHDD